MSDETRDANVRLQADVDPYRRQMQGAVEDTNKLSLAVDKLGTKLDGITKRAGKKLLLFGAGAGAGILGVTAEAASFEKKLETLNATAAITDRNFGAVRKQVNQLSKEFPISRDAAIELVTTLEKLGVQAPRQIAAVSEAMVKLSASTGESLGGLTTGMVELGKQMGTLSAGNMGTFANSLTLVSAKSGVAAQGVLQFAQAIAPTARAAGLTETQVLGVSAAFSKAGADGYAAANTFNTMLADITRQVVTGSPEIAKYANLIGVTSAQFKSMDRATAITDIFEAINSQGPDAIKTLDRLGFDGVRMMRSIQAVSQSGGLRQAIDQAVSGSTNTTSLDKGSAAAMNGLADSVTKVRTQFEELATNVGTPFVQAFTPVVDIFDHLLTILNALAEPLAKVGAALGGIMTLGATALGGSLVMSRMNSILGAASFVGRSTPVMGARAGFREGRAAAAGTPIESQAGTYNRWFAQPFFRAGMGFGQASAGGNARGIFGAALTAPVRAATWFANEQANFYRDARRPGTERPQRFLGTIGNLGTAARHPLDFVAGLRSDVSPTLHSAGEARTAEEFGKSLRFGIKATAERTAIERGAIGPTRQLAVSTGALTRAFIRLEMQSVATGAATIGRGLRGVAGGAMGLFGGPIGVGLLGGGILAEQIYSRRKAANESMATDGSADIDKYNVAIGVATSELGTFATAVKEAYSNLPKATTLSDVQKISSEVISLARSPDRKLINENVKDFNTTRGQAAYLTRLGITNPKQMQVAQADLVQQFGVSQAQNAVDLYYRQGGKTNYQDLIGAVTGQQSGGLFSKDRLGFVMGGGKGSGTSREMVREIFDSIQNQQVQDSKSKNSSYGDQKAQNNFLELLSGATGKHQVSTPMGRATAAQIMRTYEERFLKGEKTGFNPQQFQDISSDKERATAISNFLAFQARPGARKAFGELGLNSDGVVGQAQLNRLATTTQSDYTKRITSIGALGSIAMTNSTIQNAAVKDTGSVNAQYMGIQELFTQAQGLGKTFSGTDSELQKLKAAIQDVDDPLYKMAENAQAFNAMMRQNAQGYMTRQGRLSDSVANYRSVMAGPRDAPDFQERAQGATQELEGSKQQYYQYMLAIVQAQKNFSIQMDRGEQDMNRSIFRSNRDFQIQMRQSSADFYRSRQRQERDFGISMRRQAEDAAKGVYDPWRRVYSQYTADAGTLLQNLTDQNQRINNQNSQLNKLGKMGLSRKAIDVLGLSDPQNAQQLERLYEDILSDPKMIARINSKVGKRVAGTTSLVQSEYSEQFRRQKDDFARGLRDAQHDFERGQKRANDAHTRMLNDMATDYHTSVKRAQEDLARMSEDLNGKFGDTMVTALGLIKKNLGKLGTATIKELNAVKRAFPELFTNSLGYGGGSGGSGGSSKGSGGFSASALDHRTGLDTGAASGGSGGSSGSKIPSGLTKVQRMAYQAMIGKGWGAGQWNELKTLVNNESGWRPNAQNPNSSAYGLFQFLDATWKGVGGHKTSDPGLQIEYGLRYIKNRYGSPTKALNFWMSQSPHWYGGGGVFKDPQMIGVGERGPEAVVPLAGRAGHNFMSDMYKEISREMIKNMGAIGSTVAYRGGGSYIDASTNFTGPITVKADDPNRMARELEARARIKKLTRPTLKTS